MRRVLTRSSILSASWIADRRSGEYVALAAPDARTEEERDLSNWDAVLRDVSVNEDLRFRRLEPP